MSLEKLKNGLSQYVLHSNYNTSIGDLVPVIVDNAIHLNVIILIKSGMNFIVHGICIDQSVNIVLVVKSGEHYDLLFLAILLCPRYLSIITVI